MGFADFLGSIVKALTPPGFSDSPNCAKCMSCNARIKELPSGERVRVFTCPYTGEYDNLYSVLPSVNPTDTSTYEEYVTKYRENLDYIYDSMSNCVEQAGGAVPLRTNDFIPITRYAELKYSTENMYRCGHFKPCLYLDNSGSYYIKDNEMLYNTSVGDLYFDNLSEEDKALLRSLR